MTMSDKELYDEENLQVQKDIRDKLTNSLTVPIMKFEMPDTMKANIVNEVRAKITDIVKIDDSSIKDMNSEVTKTLEDLSATIVKAIQDAKVDPVTEVSVKNILDGKQSEVTVKNLSTLEKAVAGLADVIIANQPVVNVAKQDTKFPHSAKDAIPVRLSDGKSFYNAIFQAVSSASGETDPLIGYQITELDESGTPKYYGYAKPNGQWYILKETSGSYRYTRGYRLENSGSLFVDAWTDRANLTYDYIFEVF